MKTQNRTLVLAVAAAALLAPLTAEVMGRGADSPGDSIFHTRDLGRLSVGAEGGQDMRRLVTDEGERATVKSRFGYGFLSLDVFSWLTLTGGGGVLDSAIDRSGVRRSARPLWMAGFQASLWQHDIFDPSFFESRGTIQLLGSYLEGDMVDRRAMRPWQEWRGALIASAERYAKKDFGEDTHAVPYSLRLFAGPYYSEVDPDGFGRNQEIGVTGGVDIKLARGFSLGYEVRYRDYTSHAANLVLHF